MHYRLADKKLKEGDKIPYKIGLRWWWLTVDKVSGHRFEGHVEEVRRNGYASSRTAEIHKEQLLIAKRTCRRSHDDVRSGASTIAFTDYARGEPAARKDHSGDS
jgi:hypothetical protein